MSIGAAEISPESERRTLLIARALDLVERTLVILAFAFYVGANIASGREFNVILSLADVVTVYVILLRKPADNVSFSPTDWALAILGTVGAMFARPGGDAVTDSTLPAVLLASGLYISVVAKLSLNRRFGVAPANRGVQARGAYAFVRHPMYLGYALMNAAYLLVNPTLFNAIVYAFTWACQIGRVLREERWLSQDPAYRDYAKAVRFRFIPGVF